MYFQNFSISTRELGARSNLISCVHELTKYVEPAAVDDRVIVILNRFHSQSKLKCIPVLGADGMLCGLVNRHRFMEKHMVGKYGFGHSLNYYKNIASVLEGSFLAVDQQTTIEEVAKFISGRDHDKLYDDVCVTMNNRYCGVVSVSEILNGIMENNLILAVGANPLSGLPGNDYIQRKIHDVLEKNRLYDICYIDIDYFKPYNDKYGFAKGDEVITRVADLMTNELEQLGNSPAKFAGHIGGDDFILITEPKDSEGVCRNIIDRFEEGLTAFHSPAELKDRSYQSISRQGRIESFPLLSLSIAIVSSGVGGARSYAELSSLTSEVKKKAKQISGSAICRNQRKNQQKTKEKGIVSEAAGY